MWPITLPGQGSQDSGFLASKLAGWPAWQPSQQARSETQSNQPRPASKPKHELQDLKIPPWSPPGRQKWVLRLMGIPKNH